VTDSETRIVAVRGIELRAGDTLLNVDGTPKAIVVAVRSYVLPARVLHDVFSVRHPFDMPVRLIDTNPSCFGFTAFNDDYYEVRR